MAVKKLKGSGTCAPHYSIVILVVLLMGLLVDRLRLLLGTPIKAQDRIVVDAVQTCTKEPRRCRRELTNEVTDKDSTEGQNSQIAWG